MFSLQWNISDYFFQRGETIEKELEKEEALLQKQAEEKGVPLHRPFHPAPPFDCLWLCLYSKLGELCVDTRPAVRKSGGQTLFSTVGAHGTLLQHATWHTVLWKVQENKVITWTTRSREPFDRFTQVSYLGMRPSHLAGLSSQTCNSPLWFFAAFSLLRSIN